MADRVISRRYMCTVYRQLALRKINYGPSCVAKVVVLKLRQEGFLKVEEYA